MSIVWGKLMQPLKQSCNECETSCNVCERSLKAKTFQWQSVKKCLYANCERAFTVVKVVFTLKSFIFSVQTVESHFQFLRWTVSVTTLFVFFVVYRIVSRKWYPSWTLSELMKTNPLWYDNFIFFNVLHVYKSLSLINYWTVRWNICT